MEDARGGAEGDGAGQRGATDDDHPAAALVPAAQAARDRDAEAGDECEAEQPACLAAERGVEQPQHARRAAERSAPAADGLRAAGLAGEAAEAVVAEDQGEDGVVARA
jgi:hypothetical protein